MKKNKIINFLGIDPGFGRVGWGVIEVEGAKLVPIDYGCWETSKEKDFGERLHFLADNLRAAIKKFQPDVLVVEQLFFFKNLKTAINVAQARGVVILIGHENCLPLLELTPLQAKQAISGYGQADKKQMQIMVKMILKLEKVPQPDDAADALAMAIAGASYWRSPK